MTAKNVLRLGIVLGALVTLTACGNTIRGVGRDTANAVNATQAAGSDVAAAAE